MIDTNDTCMLFNLHLVSIIQKYIILIKEYNVK